MDPHTTQKKGRNCNDCHRSPKSVGLGHGSIVFRNQRFDFVPALSNSPTQLGIEQPLDSITNIEGKQLVNVSRPGLRPFQKDEIVKILEVGICLTCHQDSNDLVMKKWLQSGTAPKICLPFKRVIHNLFLSSEKY